MVTIIDLFSNFFLNDLFGAVFLGVLFLIFLVLTFLFFSDSPKITLALLPTILLFGLSNSGYVPQWIAAVIWIAMGILWGLTIIRLIR